MKVELNLGEAKEVTMILKSEGLKLWNEDMKYVLEPGEFEVYVGSSVGDIRLKGKFEI